MLFHKTTAALALGFFLVISASAFERAKAQGGPLVYCRADAERICPGVPPGGGRVIQCLKQHKDDVTIGCAKELKAIKAKMGK